ncbi:MAG: HEAT repeat domain-containing protein [Gemmatimonadetes bacterium]|nr:HEAT repeat domain-containing protein [Gemmatimonadota bacterium]
MALVEEMLRMFGRAVRAHQLYLHNNPTYLRALDSARAAFAPIWGHTDELVIEVTDTQLRWEGHAVINEPDKTTDALPWILYKDGIRELRLMRDVEQQELVALIDILTRVRKASPDEDDLLTLLWEQEFAFVRYRYVDMTLEGVAPLDASELAKQERLVDPQAIQEPPQENVLPSGVVNLDDFDATLYFLDEREVEYLRDAVATEYASDLRGNVVAILLDVFEVQVDPAIRDEIVGVLDNLLVHLLTAGQLRTVAHLLREVNIAANRARDLTPQQRETILSLPNRMSEPEALSQLLQSLDERTDMAEQSELNELFDQLRVSALGTIFSWLGRLQTPRVRTQLEAAAQRLAAANTGELVRLIGAPEREVSLEAIRRSGAMRAAAAVPALARLMTQQDGDVRLAAVQALAEIGTPGALQQLERSIDDPSREVRVATARAFAARVHRPALAKIEAAIKGKRVSEADLTEKMALFEAFGAMCGEGGVTLLDGLLNTKSFFGRREDPELRACAAMALGRVATPNAIAVLRRAASDKEILVRNAVNRALRGGTA